MMLTINVLGQYFLEEPIMSNQNFFQNLFSFQMPDFTAMRDAFSKNMQLITSANQVAVEFAQNSTRRNAEIIQKNTHKGFECARDAMSSRSPEELHTLQSQYVANVVESSCNQAKEMMEIGTKAAMEVVDMFKDAGQCTQHQTCQTKKTGK